jgi:release factor glutamine methyltransferase
MAMSVREALAAAAARLGGGDEARIDAEWLLLHALGVDHGWLFAHATDPLPADAAARFEALLDARAAGTPVAHLRGRQGFWSLELEVAPATLIPRGDTERLVELALERLPADAPARVLDLGTGSGAIALAIARERPRAEVTAVDASAGALAVARRNAASLGLGRVRLLHGDWFAPVAGEVFALICSNPPYLADDDPHLDAGDLRFEPRSALASGPDGLDDLRRIVAAAPAHLRPGGWLLLEHGWTQGEAVRALLQAAGFLDVATARDLEDRDRVSLGRRPG